MNNVLIKTKRLQLGNLRGIDKKELYSFFQEDKIKENYMLPDNLAEIYDTLFLRLKRDPWVFGIYKEESLIGMINGFMNDGVLEFGYFLGLKYEGNGYMQEALEGVLAYSFQKEVQEIQIGAFDANLKSLKVLEKSGMKRLSKEEEIFYHGKKHTCIYYGIKKGDMYGG